MIWESVRQCFIEDVMKKTNKKYQKVDSLKQLIKIIIHNSNLYFSTSINIYRLFQKVCFLKQKNITIIKEIISCESKTCLYMRCKGNISIWGI